MFASDAVDLVLGLVWPVLIAVVVIALYPTIRRLMESRGFSVKVGVAEISVQQASDQLSAQVEDLREQLAALKDRVEAAHGPAPAPAPAAAAEDVPRSILWVDDHPENNVYEIAALQGKGLNVVHARSTAEAGSALGSSGRFGAIISDMGRIEDGSFKPEAGMAVIGLARDQGLDSPVFIYSSAPTIARTRERALEAGAAGATASATELMQMLGRIGLA
jgi:CheY-like chemotaxis protein